MGKVTGFLEYSRENNPAVEPQQRISGFQEFHTELSEKQRREQGGRCMNCGVPFCQSAFGCPLHNLIPEWNDEIYSGNWSHALARLLKTNSFPEFTGRVCPALCESACVCGMEDIRKAVTVKDNELALIEYAWEHGLITTCPPAVRTEKKVAVIGSGPAGLAAADMLNRRGHRVVVYERDDLPGGLLMYGIPNMKLDKNVVLRRIRKMEAEGIRFECNTEIGKTVSGEQLSEEYDAVVLCCGARKPRTVAGADYSVKGVLPAVEYLTASTKAVLTGKKSTCSAEARDVIVIGNGDTATDCVATAVRQKARSVIQLVRKPRAESIQRVWPYRIKGEKREYGHEEAEAHYGKDPRLYEASLVRLLTGKKGQLNGVIVRQGEEERQLAADMLLIAAGFSGVEPEIAGTFGLELNEKERIGGVGFQTGRKKIFACGDARRGPSLVVWAIAEGRACAKEVDCFLEGYTNL